MNDNQKKQIVFSRVPELVKTKNVTKGPSTSCAILNPSQYKPWRGFAHEVRTVTSRALGAPPSCFSPFSVDRYITGNEMGVFSKFVAHVLEPVGSVSNTFNPIIAFGDCQISTAPPPRTQFPDAVAVRKGPKTNKVGGVIEMKTAWTVDLTKLLSKRCRRALGTLRNVYLITSKILTIRKANWPSTWTRRA